MEFDRLRLHRAIVGKLCERLVQFEDAPILALDRRLVSIERQITFRSAAAFLRSVGAGAIDQHLTHE